MSWRNTILLALAVAAVAAIAYRDLQEENPDGGWQTVFEEPLPTPESAAIEHLVHFDPKSVIAIALHSDNREARAQRTAYGWSGTSTPGKINTFLDNLLELAVVLSIDEEPTAEDLAGYGLAEPRARIRLEREGSEAIDIALGHHNPSTTAIYARVSQRPGVVLTGAVAMWDLSEAFDALQVPHPPPD